MKLPFRPRPSREELVTLPLQVIVQDFPETLEDFRDHGVLPEEFGERTVRDLPHSAELLEGLAARTAWRPQPVRA